jgi:hypothetical protein
MPSARVELSLASFFHRDWRWANCSTVPLSDRVGRKPPLYAGLLPVPGRLHLVPPSSPDIHGATDRLALCAPRDWAAVPAW